MQTPRARESGKSRTIGTIVTDCQWYNRRPHAIRSIDGSLNGFVDSALAGIGRRRRVVLALPHFHGIALSVAASGLIAAVPKQVADILPETLGLSIMDAASGTQTGSLAGLLEIGFVLETP